MVSRHVAERIAAAAVQLRCLAVHRHHVKSIPLVRREGDRHVIAVGHAHRARLVSAAVRHFDPDLVAPQNAERVGVGNILCYLRAAADRSIPRSAAGVAAVRLHPRGDRAAQCRRRVVLGPHTVLVGIQREYALLRSTAAVGPGTVDYFVRHRRLVLVGDTVVVGVRCVVHLDHVLLRVRADRQRQILHVIQCVPVLRLGRVRLNDFIERCSFSLSGINFTIVVVLHGVIIVHLGTGGIEDDRGSTSRPNSRNGYTVRVFLASAIRIQIPAIIGLFIGIIRQSSQRNGTGQGRIAPRGAGRGGYHIGPVVHSRHVIARIGHVIGRAEVHLHRRSAGDVVQGEGAAAEVDASLLRRGRQASDYSLRHIRRFLQQDLEISAVILFIAVIHLEIAGPAGLNRYRKVLGAVIPRLNLDQITIVGHFLTVNKDLYGNGSAGVRSPLPLGVEDVLTIVVGAHLRIRLDQGRSRSRFRFRGPADEFVALAGEAALGIRLYRKRGVDGHGLGGHIGSLAAVGVVGHGDRGNVVHIVGYQDNVCCQDREFLAGIVLACSALHRPIGKLLARRRSERFRIIPDLYAGSSGIAVCIPDSFPCAVTRHIGHGVTHTLVNGINGGVSIQRLVNINRISCAVHPLEQFHPGILDGCQRVGILSRIGYRAAYGNRGCEVLRLSRDVHVDGHRNRLLRPIGVENQVIGRHRLAGEVKGDCLSGDLLRLHRIPAHELRVGTETGGAFRGGAVLAQRRAIVHLRPLYIPVVVQGKRIIVPMIVEVKSVICEVLLIVPEPRLFGREPREALDLVVLLFVRRVVEVSLYRLQQFVRILRRSPAFGVAVHLLHIVVNRFQPIAALIIEVEGDVRTGHPVQGLEGVVIGAPGILPRPALIGGGEGRFRKLARDRSVVLGRNGGHRLPVSAGPTAPFILLEGQCIRSPGEIHVQHGGSVRRDGHRGGVVLCLVIGEMLPVRYTVGQRMTAAVGIHNRSRIGPPCGHSQRRIILIVSVLTPVDHGILHPRALPYGIEGGRFLGSDALDDFTARRFAPADKHISAACGLFNRAQSQRFSLGHIPGGYTGTTLGIEGDPIAGHRHRAYIGVLGDLSICRKRCFRPLDDPLGHYSVLRLIIRGNRDAIAVFRRRYLRPVDGLPVRRQEVDIISVAEFRSDRIRLILRQTLRRGKREGHKLVILIPAFKLLPSGHRGGLGFGDSPTSLDDLGRHRRPTCHKVVGRHIVGAHRVDGEVLRLEGDHVGADLPGEQTLDEVHDLLQETKVLVNIVQRLVRIHMEYAQLLVALEGRRPDAHLHRARRLPGLAINRDVDVVGPQGLHPLQLHLDRIRGDYRVFGDVAGDGNDRAVTGRAADGYRSQCLDRQEAEHHHQRQNQG